ncbi:hypothetical protein [Larkinella soli]|uniref:hypothetical protein n=1 Tax=Larkinella soli TaxID=1770527 RepID=UPI000FFC554C|nr:hypothetical protein [Larkinella soli]
MLIDLGVILIFAVGLLAGLLIYLFRVRKARDLNPTAVSRSRVGPLKWLTVVVGIGVLGLSAVSLQTCSEQRNKTAKNSTENNSDENPGRGENEAGDPHNGGRETP